MQHLIISALSWHLLPYLLVITTNVILVTAFILHGRALNNSISHQSIELSALRATNQMQSEQIELLHSGYKAIPEHLSDHSQIGYISDNVSVGESQCWRSLMKITAGDATMAEDLAGMLINELPLIVHQLEHITSIGDSEQQLLHQWQGLLRCCGLAYLADHFQALERDARATGASLELSVRDQLLNELRQALVEAFHSVRNRELMQVKMSNHGINSIGSLAS